MEMNGNEFDVGAMLIAIGLLMLLLVVLIKSGRFKILWLVPSSPITPGGIVYWGIPGSLALITVGIGMLFPKPSYLLLCVAGLWWIPGLILLVRHPRWLTPRWLLWLEENHSDIEPLLKKEAGGMKAKEWVQRVSTQRGLEEWVDEVRRKDGLVKE